MEESKLEQGNNEECVALENEVEEEEEGLEISIHALSRYLCNNAMKLLGRIGTCSVEIFSKLRADLDSKVS